METIKKKLEELANLISKRGMSEVGPRLWRLA
jgi:hypothetical protein